MNETQKGFVQLHLSVLLAGFTGLFGRLITLNEVDIVWYRMLFTSLILLVFTGLPRVGWRKFLQLCGCGALLGFHWILFYGSIKASNVSIGVICFSLIGFFTAVFEPLLFKKHFSWLELCFSLITVLGVFCIFSFDARYRYGIAIGVVSSAVWCLLYLLFRCPLSLWYCHWRGVFRRLRPLCHLQQEGECGRTQSDSADVSNVRWTCGNVGYHSCLSPLFPQPSACRCHP